MSFEGRLQEVCSRGHYDETSTVYMNEKFKQKRRSKHCRYCGRRYVWRNLLNDTNYLGEGFIPIIVLREAVFFDGTSTGSWERENVLPRIMEVCGEAFEGRDIELAQVPMIVQIPNPRLGNRGGMYR